MKINEIITDWMIMPQTIKPLGLIRKPGGGFDFKNHSNNRANEAPIEQDKDNPIAKPYVDMPEWKALHDMDDEIIQAYIKHKEVAEADGLQPADLKRLGQSKPKVYVHKDGKTIMVPRKQAKNYIAKGWKKSALRAETSYESKLADMLNQRLK